MLTQKHQTPWNRIEPHVPFLQQKVKMEIRTKEFMRAMEAEVRDLMRAMEAEIILETTLTGVRTVLYFRRPP